MYDRNSSWDRFFEDLEGQLTSEWEAERAALDSEAERLRLSTVVMRERFTSMAPADEVGMDLSDGTTVRGAVAAVGADWMALGSPASLTLVPLAGVHAVSLSHEAMLRSARPPVSSNGLTARMTFGFVLRDAARRRIPLSIHLGDGRLLTGTIDRAGADHLDIALHDIDAPRRVREVQGYRIVPFTAVSWIRWDAARAMPGT